MTALTNDQPAALRPTMVGRRAAKEAWEARNPIDSAADLVCIYDQDETVENPRTKEIINVVRVRRYARNRALQTDVAVRYDDEPIRLYNVSAASPQPKSRLAGILRRNRRSTPAEPLPHPSRPHHARWRSNRPAGDLRSS